MNVLRFSFQIDLKRGLTLDKELVLLESLHLNARKLHANEVSVERLRQDAKGALSDAKSGTSIIVNYFLPTVGFTQYFGHFSPLVAYHEASDQFLILDCFPLTESVWVDTKLLHEAMMEIDGDSKKTRGYILIDE